MSSTHEQLDSILFENPALNTYAILDGASIPDLLDHLDSLQPESVCLYRGELKDGIDEVRLSHDRDHLVMESQGYPNHPTAIFPNSGNPNAIRVQEFTFRLPLVPQRAEKITRLPMGPIGVALNGVVFFNPFECPARSAWHSTAWSSSIRSSRAA